MVTAAIGQIAQTTRGKVVGQHTLDETLSETDRINIDVREIAADPVRRPRRRSTFARPCREGHQTNRIKIVPYAIRTLLKDQGDA